MLLLSAMPRTDVQELGKLGAMVGHFKQEHQGEGLVAFIGFLAEHYGDEFNGKLHHGGQHSHQDLPLHNLSASVVPVLHQEPAQIQIIAYAYRLTSGYPETSLVSFVTGNRPWQPPKKG